MMYSTNPNNIAAYRNLPNTQTGSTARKTCPNCRKPQSVAQFWSRDNKPVLKFCRTCRGLK